MLIFFWLYGFSIFGQSSSYQFKHISVESGLSHASINNMIQDTLGHIWLATQFGLNRYDGKRFDTFFPLANDSTSLQSGFVQTVYQDANGHIWVGTHIEGLHRFIPENQSFMHYDIPQSGEEMVDAKVILEDHRGMLFVGTHNKGLYYVDSAARQMKPLSSITQIPPALEKVKINALIEDRNQCLWVGTQKEGLFIWDKNRNSWNRFPILSKNPLHVGNEHIRSLYQDKEGSIWVGTESGLFYWQTEQERFKHLPLPDYKVPLTGDIYIRSLLEDRFGKLWIGTEGGLYLFQREDSSITSFLYDPDNSHSISNNDVITILEDRSGVLWFGLDNGGLNYLDERERPFQFLGSQKYSQENPLDVQMARSITQLEDGKFLVGTMAGGLRYCDSAYQNCIIFNRSASNVPANFNNKIYSTWEDRQGNIWIGDADGDIFQFLPEEEKLIPSPYKPCESTGTLIDKNLGINYFDFYEDPGGALWAVRLTKNQVPGGIYKYQPEKSSFVCWRDVVPYADRLPSQDIYCMVKQQHIFWIGTTAGLYKLNTLDGSLQHFEENLERLGGLTNNHVRRLHLDRQGILWIGSLEYLHSLDTGSGKWMIYEDPKGWLRAGVMAFEEDDKGNLWISTQQGILKTKFGEGFVAYSVNEGLEPVHEFYMYSSYKNIHSGHIMFGGGAGLIIFHPDSIVENSYIPSVFFSKLTKYSYHQNGELINKEERYLINQEDLSLCYLDRNLTFEISNLNYFKGDKNQFKYKLGGPQTEWIELGPENKFTLTNLDPGVYTLWAKGSNNDGKWNEVPTKLTLTVHPPWWKTQGAYLAYFLLSVSGIWWVIFLFRQRESEKSMQERRDFEFNKLKELDAQRSKFFANISHDFRTPLTLIETPVKEQLSLLKKNGELHFGSGQGKKFFSQILHNCSNLMHLINQIMKLSQLEAGLLPLKASEQDLLVLVKQLYAQFESLASKRKIEFTLKSHQEEIWMYLDTEKMATILLNLLSNAFKFTPKREKISIQIRPSQENIEILFSNTGAEIAPEELNHIFKRFFKGSNSSKDSNQGLGIGLAVVRELVELHKGNIQVESLPPSETRFTLSLPLGKSHLQPEEIEVNQSNLPPTPLISPPFLEEELPTVSVPIDGFQEGQILVVEDNRPMRHLLRDILEPQYHVVFAEDGLLGWEKTLLINPDLVITDMRMPGMDGGEFCKHLKEDPRTNHIPVILLTARAEESTRLEALQYGADVFLPKPFSSQELLLRIHNLLEKKQKIQQFLHRKILYQVSFEELVNSQKVLSKSDKEFIQGIIKCIERNLDNPDFGVEELSKQLSVSRVHLFRKLKSTAEISPLDFIQKIRLNHATQLLIHKDMRVAEIAYAVGFSSPSHFGGRFRKYYKMTPTEFRRNRRNDSTTSQGLSNNS